VRVPAVSTTIEAFASHEVRVSTHDAAGTTRFHEPYIDVEALGQSLLPFDRSTACFRNRVEVG
jgi:hypothetical protein